MEKHPLPQHPGSGVIPETVQCATVSTVPQLATLNSEPDAYMRLTRENVQETLWKHKENLQLFFAP